MLYLIVIHWKRRAPHPDKPQTGHRTYPVAAKYPKRAITDAKRRFAREYGPNLEITSAGEAPDPARIFS